MKFSRLACLAFAASALLSLPVAAAPPKDTEKINARFQGVDYISDDGAADVGVTEVEVTHALAAELRSYQLAGRDRDQPMFFADLTPELVDQGQRDRLDSEPSVSRLPAPPEVGADFGIISDDIGNIVSHLTIA